MINESKQNAIMETQMELEQHLLASIIDCIVSIVSSITTLTFLVVGC